MSRPKIRLVGEHIVAARGLLHMSQGQLAEAAGVALPTIVNFEKGHVEPKPETVEAIRAVLEGLGIEFSNGDNPGVKLFRDRANASS